MIHLVAMLPRPPVTVPQPKIDVALGRCYAVVRHGGEACSGAQINRRINTNNFFTIVKTHARGYRQGLHSPGILGVFLTDIPTGLEG